MDHAFSPRTGVPLSDALRTSLEVEGRTVNVAASDVWLEMENFQGEIITIRRGIVGPRNERLVTVWHKALLTTHAPAEDGVDYFVRIEGAADRERGFHTFLAGYLGYELPNVIRTDGTETKLYLECLLGLFFVEQQTGWSGLFTRMPFHFRIKDLSQRAIEFILALDTYADHLRRQELTAARQRIVNEWRDEVSSLTATARRAAGIVDGAPSAPVLGWRDDQLIVKVASGNEWYPLDRHVQELSTELIRLQAEPIPPAQSGLDLSSELEATRAKLVEAETGARLLDNEAAVERAHLRALDTRIKTLAADLRRYEDEKRLKSYGSLEGLRISAGQCPTCEQPVTPVLLNQIEAVKPMPVEENIMFIREQINSITNVRLGIVREIEAREQRFKAFEQAAISLRERMRVLRDTMAAASNSPSLAAVERRVRLEIMLKEAERSAEATRGHRARLADLARQWAENEAARSQLPAQRLSTEDVRKLGLFSRLFLEQLGQYGFRTYKPETMGISTENYRPTHEDYDVGYLSASDAIRTIWAYLHGLLEVDRETNTNHPGVLILDEPRQQATEMVSFASLLARASTAGAHGHQVIAATSEDEALISRALSNVPHHYVAFRGKVFGKLS